MRSPSSADVLQHTPAPVGMMKRRGGWAPLPRPVMMHEVPDEVGKRTKPVEKFLPHAEWILRQADSGYPTLMDLVVRELLAPSPDAPPSADP